mmetsp:Transcript_11091/g.24352  ORF Transcript_11091/g.24352 Transcript_11091/m.24352 type:complete len:95 (+) Transcript_11091:140-424(+)
MGRNHQSKNLEQHLEQPPVARCNLDWALTMESVESMATAQRPPLATPSRSWRNWVPQRWQETPGETPRETGPPPEMSPKPWDWLERSQKQRSLD